LFFSLRRRERRPYTHQPADNADNCIWRSAKEKDCRLIVEQTTTNTAKFLIH
jgi:hypothetical protein